MLDRYRQSYPTAEKMGQLRFEEIEIAPTGENTVHVSGRYRLNRADGPQTGRFFLTMRRLDGAWVIVKDYTVND